MYSYLKCNVKRGTQNTNFKIINQHKNDPCHVQSLKKDFYLDTPFPFTMFSIHCHKNHLKMDYSIFLLKFLSSKYYL